MNALLTYGACNIHNFYIEHTFLQLLFKIIVIFVIAKNQIEELLYIHMCIGMKMDDANANKILLTHYKLS